MIWLKLNLLWFSFTVNSLRGFSVCLWLGKNSVVQEQLTQLQVKNYWFVERKNIVRDHFKLKDRKKVLKNSNESSRRSWFHNVCTINHCILGAVVEKWLSLKKKTSVCQKKKFQHQTVFSMSVIFLQSVEKEHFYKTFVKISAVR